MFQLPFAKANTIEIQNGIKKTFKNSLSLFVSLVALLSKIMKVQIKVVSVACPEKTKNLHSKQNHVLI
jgi:hypothetical protein